MGNIAERYARVGPESVTLSRIAQARTDRDRRHRAAARPEKPCSDIAFAHDTYPGIRAVGSCGLSIQMPRSNQMPRSKAFRSIAAHVPPLDGTSGQRRNALGTEILPICSITSARRMPMQTLARIASAGSAATAIAFGPARAGFGLFLPQFREAFSISTSVAGVISSLGFAAFLTGL